MLDLPQTVPRQLPTDLARRAVAAAPQPLSPGESRTRLQKQLSLPVADVKTAEPRETAPPNDSRHQSLDTSTAAAFRGDRPRAKTLSTVVLSGGEHGTTWASSQTSDASFLFLQMQALPYFAAEARRLEEGATRPGANQSDLDRAIKMLDAVPAFDVHKIGVLYVRPGQTTGAEILANEHGSPRYLEFLQTLGRLQRLRGCEDYCGGLDTSGDADGEYFYVWTGDVTQVVYHVATLMPTRAETDEQCLAKKRFIGNDHVNVVFNEGKVPFQRHWLTGGVNFVHIVVEPVDSSNYRLSVLLKEGMEDIISTIGVTIVSADFVGFSVRQMAIHANIASLVHRKMFGNWQTRLKEIANIRKRFAGAAAPPQKQGSAADFTKFA